MRMEFGGLRFELPDGWVDVTAELPDESPFTLAKETGVGAIQFSFATYEGGVYPNMTIDHLRSFITTFCDQQNIDDRSFLIEKINDLQCISIVANTNSDIIGAWYLTNGGDIAFITYFADRQFGDQAKEELVDATALIASIQM